MIDDKKEFFTKIGIELLLVIIWFGTLFLLNKMGSSNPDNISILEVIIGILLSISSIGIIYFGTKWTFDITDIVRDKYGVQPFNIIESTLFFIFLNLFIILTLGKFFPSILNSFNTYFMKTIFGFIIPLKIFNMNNILYYILLFIFGGGTTIVIFLKARDSYLKYIIPLLIIMLFCGLVNTIGIISLLVIAFNLIKRIILLIIFIIGFIIFTAMADDTSTSKNVITSKNSLDKEVYYSHRDSNGSIYLTSNGEEYHVSNDGKVTKK